MGYHHLLLLFIMAFIIKVRDKWNNKSHMLIKK